MSNIENLTSKILEDSKREAIEITNKAKLEAETIINEKVSSAEKVKADIVEKAKLEGKSKKDRIISNAKLEVRNKKLEAKQKIIGNVFNDTVAKLSKMSKEEFLVFMKNCISSLKLEGSEELLVSRDFKDAVTSDVLSGLNIKLSKEDRNIPSGFIIINNGIELNYTFEALVLSLREELEYQVASILFN